MSDQTDLIRLPHFRCTVCSKVIPFATPHIAIQFMRTGQEKPENGIKRYCRECSFGRAVHFEELFDNNVKEVRIRLWWA